MRFENLQDWLRWQESLHPRAIDPGLERVGRVALRLGLDRPDCLTLTVAGTNGKGSSVACAESILRAAGYRTGAYTSPHLLRYNERIRIDGVDSSDHQLLRAFDAIDQARGGITLSYFEFGTLAALYLFRQASVDVQLLEVGLGGRLDAVNLVDADVALVASIGLDHAEWLGHDLETIGREKAGIFRTERPAVFAASAMPGSIAEVAGARGSRLVRAGEHFHWSRTGDSHWQWRAADRIHADLPLPGIPGDVQLANAAGVIAALGLLPLPRPIGDETLRQGLAEVRLGGRLQRLPGTVEWLLDVAHNADSARVLADWLIAHPVTGRRIGVIGLMQRKDPAAVLTPLCDCMDGWLLLDLRDAEAWSPETLAGLLPTGRVHRQGEATALVDFSERNLGAGDQLVIFGSFRTVEQMLVAREVLLPNAGTAADRESGLVSSGP
ncbi:bifunctional tetrahydrofolate synthase/dihydrofolate synthase [Methylonatrum kenyense]|uniref:bifunctional tetrahydrofolate synthase/dihydrofolate synthase n=1 Tax=Methylonatrum kenyense TaxID=455253 RepID=UPI0020C11EEF|nr:bifunctional tetrahydrofolate synthase/dihydrofolate synthase [Methylonatrum kenyense]MCK8514850.1 bifunctional tetrahydrofolate synthase/dihydrofolate synthase [Methylonatrum kenyense]